MRNHFLSLNLPLVFHHFPPFWLPGAQIPSPGVMVIKGPSVPVVSCPRAPPSGLSCGSGRCSSGASPGPQSCSLTSQSHYGRPSTPRSSCQSQRKVAQLVMLRKQLVTLRKQLGWLQNANMNPIELARKFKCPVYELSDGASKSSSKRN